MQYFNNNSLHRIIIIITQQAMGCNIVSAYTDQTTGSIGYPEQVVTDLYDRNYSAGNLLITVPSSHPYSVLGFNQSFAQARLFSVLIKNVQYMVYSAGRFLVIRDCIQGDSRALMHEDKIVALDVKQKLCATASIGGRIILWDLEFMTQKINIRVPNSMVISSLSLTSTYIFCTDIEQPECNVYCFDIRTTKLRCVSKIRTYEPILKGISWGSNHHITCTVDGLWFCRVSESKSQLEFVITKGMFRIFPKTSMTCLAVVDETYVVSGSIDGYVFLWAFYQCQKVIKVADSCVTDMALSGNKIIVGNLSNNLRIFEFEVKKKKEMDQAQKQNGQITQDFISILIDSYQRDPIQCILISKLNSNIYYAQTRSGLLYNKMIPQTSTDYQLQSAYKQLDQRIIEYEKDCIKYIYQDALWMLKFNDNVFKIKKIKMNDNLCKNWKVDCRYVACGNGYCQIEDKVLFCFVPELQLVCYCGSTDIFVSNLHSLTDQPDLKPSQLQRKTILKFEQPDKVTQQPRGIVSFCLNQTIYLIVFFETYYNAIITQNKNIPDRNWSVEQQQEYDKQIPKQIKIGDQIVKFETRNHQYRCTNMNQQEEQGLTAELTQKTEFIHCVHEIEDIGKLSDGRLVSFGGGIGLAK